MIIFKVFALMLRKLLLLAYASMVFMVLMAVTVKSLRDSEDPLNPSAPKGKTFGKNVGSSHTLFRVRN